MKVILAIFATIFLFESSLAKPFRSQRRDYDYAWPNGWPHILQRPRMLFPPRLGRVFGLNINDGLGGLAPNNDPILPTTERWWKGCVGCPL